MITITIRDKEVNGLLSRLRTRVSTLKPVLTEIGEIVRSSVVRTFQEGGHPTRWVASRRAIREGGQTLTDTGRLRDSINVRAYARHVEVGTNVKYAAIHQFGGTTGPRIITPKHKKALYWPGAAHPVRAVKHPGSTIPARPFLAVQDEDWTEIKRAIREYLERE